MKTILFFIALVFALPSGAVPVEKNLEPSWKGGTLTGRLQAWPKSLNNYVSSDVYTSMMSNFVGLSLASKSYETWEDLPFLADRWEVGKDRQTYTFYLNSEATWFDEKPVTADDVKFTFDLVYDRKKCVLCEPVRNFIGPIEKVEVIDKQTVKIKMERVHFDNLARIGGMLILPKHKYSKGNFDKDFNKQMWGGGPYVYDKKSSKYKKKMVFKRRKNYWANKYPHIRESFNFDKIIYKYIKDATVAFEAFKRRELDLFYYKLSEFKFWDDRSGAPYNDKRLAVLEQERFNPATWGGIAINMRSGVGADKKVRKSLQLMFNRPLIMNKIFQGHLRAVSGPFMKGSQYSSNTPATKFDLKKAAKLLKEAGFTKAGPDGYLYREVKEGGKTVKQKASLAIMYSMDDHARWLTVWKEDAKKVGFEIVPRYVEWSAATKKLDEFKFDAMVIGWSGSPVPGPAQLFHGRTANNKGSSNIPGLDHKRLNELIDKGPAMFDEKKRLAAYHEMEKIIIDEQPYIFRWTENNHKAAYWSDKIDPTEKPFKKFSGTFERDPFYFHWRAVKK